MSSATAYRIASPVFFTSAFSPPLLRDAPKDTFATRQHLLFHIESGDYFGTLATIAALIADAMESGDAASRALCIGTLQEMRDDLAYLQDTHLIIAKPKAIRRNYSR